MKFLKNVFALALVAVLVASVAPIASAYPVGFVGGGDEGDSGLDPFGHIWRIKIDSWGIPGLGDGTLGFAGPDSATDFHIRFDLPRGVTIDPTPAGGPGGFEETTRFSNTSDSVLWDRVLDADGLGVSFFAPVGGSLENGESFFVNVVFTEAISSLEFTATWTGDKVPEPGTWAMMLAGLSGVLIAVRRRRA